MNRTFAFKFDKALLTAVLTSAIIACLPAHIFAQSLDDAVTQQLRTIDGVACDILRDGDPLNELYGGLNDICRRTTGQSDTPGADSAGGGAGTPITIPRVLTKRMEKAQGEDEKAEADEREPAEVALEFGRISIFLSGEYENLNREVTTFEDGYDSDKWQLTVGADIQPTAHSVLGIALVGSDQSGNFDGGGHFDVDSYGVLAFGSFMPIDKTFIQVSGGFFDRSNERKRVARFDSDDVIPFSRTGRPDADFDANEFSAGILSGYDYSSGGATVGPRVGLNWAHTKIETYSEGGGDSGLELTFYDNDVTSLQSSIGLGGSVATSTDFGVVTMQGALDWKHEFDQDQRNIEVSFVDDTRAKRFTYQTEKPDRDFFELNAGVSVVLPKGMQGFVNFRTLLGHSYFDSYAGTIGMRIKL